ncbi:MAG: hypothetical protein PHE67_14275 [Campylobacterales bacterium]|nr:hypothetical protein [Campylobacterales bacterium]
MGKSGVCVLVGAILGAAATYGVLKNKDKIIEKFEELEDKVEATLKEKGMTAERAKEVYHNVSENVHSTMEKIKEAMDANNIKDMAREQILKELDALRAKLSK